MAKTYSGYTSKTMKKLQLDSGAWFKNYNVTTDTFQTAVTAGKLIGATRDGGQFVAKPTVRDIAVDGVKGAAKGMTVIDEWVVTLSANVLEFDSETLKLALGVADVDTATNQKYDVVSAKNIIEDRDYLDNVTWVGTLSGSEEPLIIQIYNAVNLEGMTVDFKPKSEGILSMVFKAHYTQDDFDTPPFKIYYPKTV